MVIEAPAGLGKTSLLRAACRLAAEAGVHLLRARATELERDFAYGCVRQLLEPVVARLGSRESSLFEGAAALSKPLFDPTAPPAPAPATAPSPCCTACTGSSTTSPMTARSALAVDDLHWADAESLRFFNYLAPRLDGLPLAVFASARSGEDALGRPGPPHAGPGDDGPAARAR